MVPTGSVNIWVGTRKGAFVFQSRDRQKWETGGPFFSGIEVNHVVQDPRDPACVYATTGSAWFGPHFQASYDGGRTWQLAEEGLSLSSMPDTTLKRLWHVAPGAADEPDTIYLGGDPGVLFRSRNRAKDWEIVEGITHHATREQWSEGAGGMMIHSIEALGGGRMIVGMSVGGAFLTSDAGRTWAPFNGGVLADFQPDHYPEVGQCVHKLRAHPADRETFYQQNHCGVYRARLGDEKWTDISDSLPSRFGFALAVPKAEPQTIFTIPIDSSEQRFVPGGQLRVARSRDGGDTFELLSKGLPQANAYVLVLREAMDADDSDPAGVYFGTSGGSLFYTRDAGESWSTLAEHLPPIYSVSSTNVSGV